MVNQSRMKATEQSRKFEKLARELECDESEEAFKANLVKVAKAPRAPPKPKD